MMLADNNAENIPNMRSSGSASYTEMSTIFDRMVPVTDAPRKKAPENSQTDAITMFEIKCSNYVRSANYEARIFMKRKTYGQLASM